MNDREKQFDDFCSTIQQTTTAVRKLSALENEKARAAAEGRHNTMDLFLKQEQALILTLKGLERTRMRLTEELSWKGLTFRQILNEVDEPQKLTLQPFFDELDIQLKQLLNSKDDAHRMITSRLAEFEHLLNGQGISYDEKGKPVSAAPRSFHDQYV